MKISKFNVNRSQSNLSFKSVSYVSNGLMTVEDYNNLHFIENMSGKNIEQINIIGPDMTEINPKISEVQQKLSEQNTELTRLYYLTESQGYCGRVWDESSASPVAKTYCGNLTMLQQLPELLSLGGYLVQNDHTRRKLSPTNHYYFEDGSEAKLDGTMGHYQWGWNRPFYITTWNENNLFFECISFEPIKGRESYYIPVGSISASGFAAFDREEERLVSYCNNSPRYRGGNNNAEWDNTEKTLLGKCVSNFKSVQYSNYAAKNGQGWYSTTMRSNSVIKVLFHIIMGTRNSQADFNPVKNSDGLYECGLGPGVTTIHNWNSYNATNPFISMSECVELGDYTGMSNTYNITINDITYTYNIPIFFGLKNIFGYMHNATEDEFIYVNWSNKIMTHYIRKSMYSEDYQNSYINDAVIEDITLSTEMFGWIKDLSYSRLSLIPIDTTGSHLTYYSDYFNRPGNIYTNYFQIWIGGSSDNENNSGLNAYSCAWAINSAGNYLSAYLCEFTEDFLLEPISI